MNVIINNAAIFDAKGPNKCKDGVFELTFMVNVFAPFLICKRLLSEMK